jgi:hypothetical protein
MMRRTFMTSDATIGRSWQRSNPLAIGVVVALALIGGRPASAEVTADQVKQAISRGVDYLKRQQSENGSWSSSRTSGNGQETGLTSLVTLALLTAGEPVDSPAMAKALAHLQGARADDVARTYSVALQTMALAAAGRERDLDQIAENAAWLVRAQVRKDAKAGSWAGSWGYGLGSRRGDNSNSQYALLGLNAASEAGVRIPPQTWAWARWYWDQCQSRDGGWTYIAEASGRSTPTMTGAGVSSLAITGVRQSESVERLQGGHAVDCGKVDVNPGLQRGLAWLGSHFSVRRAIHWKYYYLYGLERAGRLTGQRDLGGHDWYREGAEELVRLRDPLLGCWKGSGTAESDPLIATSFAVLFLAKGRAPVLINKLKHGPDRDWNNDPDDVRHLVSQIGRDWQHPLNWQVVDSDTSGLVELFQAPILFMNGHKSPVLTDQGKTNLRAYIEQGGFLLAESCCGEKGFDEGFRSLVRELFADTGAVLKPLEPEHPVWRTRFALSPHDHPLWGLELGCRTVLIYSAGDLSCFWNRREAEPGNPGVVRAVQLGQNIVDYATGRELPPAKLSEPGYRNLTRDTPRRGALRIAKLRHGGEWNVAPLAVPNLASVLRRPPFGFDVIIDHYELLPEDPNLVNYPLIYIHGRAAMSFSEGQLTPLRRHLEPGGGTLFADAACGSPAFDAAFREFVRALLPGKPLVPIPPEDAIYTKRVGFDLEDCRLSRSAGGARGRPRLEGIKLDGHWAVIYSRYDIGCALERHAGPDCKGYDNESALRIAANIVVYATRP